ncbi:lysine--tRNA ligase [Streptomyces radiopugnans]|nr:lysine--tRNA ligase [Streptomyces radiopugnans]
MAQSTEADWVSRIADEVIAEAERRAPGKPVVCASGLSPSGPIHLGNLREVMVPHLVADEIKRRGVPCEHILSWDDYDRFRKVPAGIEGVDTSWSEHIGKPLTLVPAPPGSEHPSWAEHFKAAMVRALDELGVEVRGISQTEMYTSGAYGEQILFAMRERARIDAVLDRYRTKVTPESAAKAAKKQSKPKDAEMSAAEIEAAEGSGAAGEDDGSTGDAGYFPYKPYCSVCDRDLTTITAYDDESTRMTYVCRCGNEETVLLSEHRRGKLVWKVDWPMRWAYEGVVFEPSGVDHQSPGSSYVVGGQLVREIFGGEQPIGPMYAFVGISGMAKMSSSKGGVPTPLDALEIMEAPLLRWLYARRRPNQSFKIAFDQEIQRLYDEWDALERKVAEGAAQPADAAAYLRATTTAAERTAPHPAPAAVPHAGFGGGHHHRGRGADAAHPERAGPGQPRPLPGRDASAPGLRAALDQHPRTGRAAHPGARGAGHRAAGLARRRRARVAAAAAGRPGRPLVAGRADHAGLRRAQGPGGPVAGGQADTGAEGGPARLLRAAVQAAGGP